MVQHFGSRSGQSLAEVLIGVALGALFIVSAATIIAPSLQIHKQTGVVQTQTQLVNELSGNVKGWAAGNWNNILSLATSSANKYYLTTSVSPFTTASGIETVTIAGASYQRYFYVDDVYRDSNGNVTSTSAGNSYDPSTKKVTVTLSIVTGDGTIRPWAPTTPLPATLDYHSAVANNGYVYTTGGSGNGSVTSSVFYASTNGDGTLGTMATTTPLPSGLWAHSAVVYNGYVYTTGGVDSLGNATSTVFYAKTNTNGTLGAWATTTPLPAAIQLHSVVASNGYIYTTGGKDSAGNATSTVFYAAINTANGTLGAWATTTPLLSAISQHSAVANNGYVYTTGGLNSLGSATSTVFYAAINTANGTLGAWATTALPTVLYENSAVAYNGYIYSIGGSTGGAAATTTVNYAKANTDGTLGAWAATAPLPAPLYYHSAVANNGYVYSTGGLAPLIVTSTVFYAPFTVTNSTATIANTFYLTRYGNNIMSQTSWAGGSGQGAAVTFVGNQYASSTNITISAQGQIQLATSGVCIPSGP